MTVVDVMLERAPQAEPEQPEPESDQVTPSFAESLSTVAVTLVDWEACNAAVVGLTETEMGCAPPVTVMTAAKDSVELATEVAVRVTVSGAGAVAGAL